MGALAGFRYGFIVRRLNDKVEFAQHANSFRLPLAASIPTLSRS
jgi:hypothetical protein